MRVISEIFLFLLITLALVFLCGILLWFLGAPFDLNLRSSIGISCISVAFLFPAMGNFWILFRGDKNRGTYARVFAGIRGLGMLICIIAFFLFFANGRIFIKPYLIIFIFGIILWFGSLPFEDHYERNYLISKGFMVTSNQSENSKIEK